MMRNYIEKSTYCGIIFIHGKGGSMLVGTKIFLIRGDVNSWVASSIL